MTIAYDGPNPFLDRETQARLIAEAQYRTANAEESTSHEQHDTPVNDCERCQDALIEAREALREWHDE